MNEDDIVHLQGQIWEPHEVATAALFFSSDEASFGNGETLFVDNAMLVGTCVSVPDGWRFSMAGHRLSKAWPLARFVRLPWRSSVPG